MKKLESLIFVLFVLIFFVSNVVLSVNSAIVENVPVKLNSENVLALNLNQGEKAKGSFSVNETYGIYFKVMNPSGNMVFDRDFVSEGTDFEIIAQKMGEYTLVFKNYAHCDSVVTVSYDVESGLAIGSFLWIGVDLIIILIVVGVITLGIFVLIRRRTNEKVVKIEDRID